MDWGKMIMNVSFVFLWNSWDREVYPDFLSGLCFGIRNVDYELLIIFFDGVHEIAESIPIFIGAKFRILCRIPEIESIL